MEKLIASKKFKIAASVAGILIIALISFSAGIKVGLRKARFSYKFGENYERNFIGHRPPMMPGKGPENFGREMEGRDFRNAFGLSGTIVSLSDMTILIKDRDEKENTVSVSDKTIIKSQRDNLKIGELKSGDRIVIFGKPEENGVINADLIRVFE